MRHGKAHRKLNRTSSHRKAMFKNMVVSLFKHELIELPFQKLKN
jgi:large subunit ribosomal protein L17